MPNLESAKAAGEAIIVALDGLSNQWPRLSELERRRTLEQCAPRMAELLRNHTAALADGM